MSQLALKLENVSKMYRLGQVGTGTLAHDLNRTWARLVGKEDPFSKIGAVNDREKSGGDYVWALRNVDFEVGEGEIVGIVGRNGAGKSTLLKLLSRVTAPTEGLIKINGRIASLLEVGTGFHPELTGRENVYLNGAILGMSRKEIAARLDEIVEFSGCAKYIDTPVKRYSSGMHVRLAFAVAAHLETDILIVDEVLAVGDAEFQQKCLGKMQDMSRNSHRTVLFVSHNLAAVRRLCPRSVLMEKGHITLSDTTGQVIERYLTSGNRSARRLVWPENEKPAVHDFVVHEVRITDGQGNIERALSTSDSVHLVIEYELFEPISNLRTIAKITTGAGIELLHTSDFLSIGSGLQRPAGRYVATCVIPGKLLNVGSYTVELVFDVPSTREVLRLNEDIDFAVEELSFDQTGITLGKRGDGAKPPAGVIHPDLEWSVEAS